MTYVPKQSKFLRLPLELDESLTGIKLPRAQEFNKQSVD